MLVFFEKKKSGVSFLTNPLLAKIDSADIGMQRTYKTW